MLPSENDINAYIIVNNIELLIAKGVEFSEDDIYVFFNCFHELFSNFPTSVNIFINVSI